MPLEKKSGSSSFRRKNKLGCAMWSKGFFFLSPIYPTVLSSRTFPVSMRSIRVCKLRMFLMCSTRWKVFPFLFALSLSIRLKVWGWLRSIIPFLRPAMVRYVARTKAYFGS